MLMRVLTLTLALTGAAVAQEAPVGLAAKIAEAAYGCWNLLLSDHSPELAVDLEITLREGGEVEGMPKITSRQNSHAKSAVGRAAQRALIQCSPYPEAEGFIGVVNITMTPKTD